MKKEDSSPRPFFPSVAYAQRQILPYKSPIKTNVVINYIEARVEKNQTLSVPLNVDLMLSSRYHDRSFHEYRMTIKKTLQEAGIKTR